MPPLVNVVLKNPARNGDFKLQIGLQESVIDLKRRLTAEYDNNPAPDQQKIIFAGKLLQDDSILADVLQQVSPHSLFFHLICFLIFLQHDTTLPQTFHIIVRPRESSNSTQQPNLSPSQPNPQLPQQPPTFPNMGSFYQYPLTLVSIINKIEIR